MKLQNSTRRKSQSFLHNVGIFYLWKGYSSVLKWVCLRRRVIRFRDNKINHVNLCRLFVDNETSQALRTDKQERLIMFLLYNL